MNFTAWISLLSALLEQRLSPESFTKRLFEARDQALASRQPVPHILVPLFNAAESFEKARAADADTQGAERDLLAHARRILPTLREAQDRIDGVASAPRPEGRSQQGPFRNKDATVGETIGGNPRFFRMSSNYLQLGCAGALVWLGTGIVQVFAVGEKIQDLLDWPAVPSAIIGVILAFIPGIGHGLAFWGATSVWHWPPLAAGALFFGVPLALMAFGWWVRLRMSRAAGQLRGRFDAR